jgi:hypothetical protein
MQKVKCITVDIGYSKLIIPLGNPKAGDFLNVLKEAAVLDCWVGESKLTGKYEFIYTALAPELNIENIDISTLEELEQHKAADVGVFHSEELPQKPTSPHGDIPF